MNPVLHQLARLPATAALLMALCVSSLSHAGAALDRVVEQGVLKVAMSGEQQPFNFVYGKSKKVVGMDVDLANQIAKLMHVKVEIVTAPFDELIGLLEAGKADVAISGMTITADRSRKVSFVGPYMLSGKSMLASANTMKKRYTADGFNSSSLKLVALKGSTSESFVQADLPKTKLTTVGNYDEGVKLLLAGKVDGMVADMPILALTRKQQRNDDLQLLSPPLSIEPLGVALATGDAEFENLLRNYMAVFEKTGFLMSLHKKWFELGESRIYQ